MLYHKSINVANSALVMLTQTREVVDLPTNCLCVTLTTMSSLDEIKANLERVHEQIAVAALRSGRDPDDITLVAVTKTHPPDIVAAAYDAGLRDFGENRVEEASVKIPAFQEHNLLAGCPRWHMVGHLQRRKARLALELFDWIHSVDSLRLAQRLSRISEENEKTARILLEVNVSGEASKYGFDVSIAGGPGVKAAFIDDVERILALPFLRPCGLMTMAPLVTNPEHARPVFAALRELRDDLSQRFPEANWHELSMGMTDDFEVAIEEGATIVRIGRAIFGERNRFR